MARVLLLFSEPDLAATPAAVAEGAGHIVVLADEAHLREALEQERIDVIVTEPALAALLALVLRGHERRPPVVLVAGEGEGAETSVLRELAIAQVVMKPYSVRALIGAINYVVPTQSAPPEPRHQDQGVT